MTASNKQLVSTLNRLYRLCQAGARGFQVVAENVSNRGLKVLLKTYAQQRAQFARELESAIQDLGGETSRRRSIRGIVHRGRIDIKATLTIGQQDVENVVLKEALLGERAAVRGYQRALEEDLPGDMKAMLQQQAREIQAVNDQVELLSGRSGRRLIVRLFDSDEALEEAVEALEQNSFSTGDNLDTVTLDEVTGAYDGNVQATSVDETIVSGAVGGAIFGSIFGAVAGVGILLFPGLESMMQMAARDAWALVSLAGTAVGAFFGVILGFLVGLGVAEEDRYLYDDSLKHGAKLVMLEIDSDRAREVTRLLHRVRAGSRRRTEPNPE
ncbi:MAG: PA2169 family four-helix-bundle protein [Candidatus Promineifilaceae bacterium]|nr:PA2169 family four-helix-bundle protein [Candidatus Promineifilaceae bacterium]